VNVHEVMFVWGVGICVLRRTCTVYLEKMQVRERLEHGIQGKKQERYSGMEGYMVRTRDV
jgi:hypothetical protein